MSLAFSCFVGISGGGCREKQDGRQFNQNICKLMLRFGPFSVKEMAKKSVEVQVFDSDFAVLLRESVTYEIKMESRSKSKLRNIAVGCVALTLMGIIYFGYFCPEQVCALSSHTTNHEKLTFFQGAYRYPLEDNLGKPLTYLSNPMLGSSSNLGPGLSYDDVLNENFQFDMKGHDVMVFLHIQKTGGTSFGKHLVRDLDLQRPCSCQRKRKRCDCFRPNRNESWLFSRYTTGWKCGLHADWTELSACVDIEMDKNEGEQVKRRLVKCQRNFLLYFECGKILKNFFSLGTFILLC